MAEISTFEEALNYIKNKQSLGIKPGLSRIKKVLEAAGNPQNSYKIIHVAGTNGKGTVAATVAKALENSGFKVGLFTSPWVTDYREQIQLNGELIPKAEFVRGACELYNMKSDCTEFEALTYIMYSYFARAGADYAVVECGMGGAGDSTNVELNNLAVITSISLDHTDFLGGTVGEIAEEKSGILRKNCSCVLYNEELREHFEGKCKKLITRGITDNLSLVNAVLDELQFKRVNELVMLPARQERIGNILLDGGHNVGAALALSPLIENETAVIAMLRDKDVSSYLEIIAPKCREIIATQINNPRAMSAEELAEIARKFCDNVEICKSASEAVGHTGVTLVCGSFYLAREIRNIL